MVLVSFSSRLPTLLVNCRYVSIFKKTCKWQMVRIYRANILFVFYRKFIWELSYLKNVLVFKNTQIMFRIRVIMRVFQVYVRCALITVTVVIYFNLTTKNFPNTEGFL